MSWRSFGNETYEVMTGWDRSRQYYFLDIYQRDRPETAIFSHLDLPNPSMTLEQIADTLRSYGITAPPTLFADLHQDEVFDRGGDFDVHYDPETGTASMQAEYGDRPDLGDASAAEPVERHWIQELADRIRTWFHRDQDRGIGL
jgi:hypothetical protein